MILSLIALCALQHSFEIPGTSHWDGLGMSTFVLDDITGDGIAEIGTGAFCTDFNGINSGSVYIYDGASLTQIRRHDGVMAPSQLGRFATALKDLDGDGVSDYAAGAPLESTNHFRAGAVYVWSGATGQRLAWVHGTKANGHFGVSIASIDDIDGDSIPDILVGAPGEYNGDGVVYAFSGDGSGEIGRYYGQSSGGGLGTGLAALDDTNGDGISDFVVGEPYARSNRGDVHLISGASITRIRRIRGQSTNAWFGYRLAGVGDADLDGITDFLVGEPCKDTVHLYNKSGNLIRSHIGPGSSGGLKQGWGHSLAGAGDVNGDGRDDYVIGAPGEWAGYSYQSPGNDTIVFNGRNGSTLMSYSAAEVDDCFGASVTVGRAYTGTNQKLLLIGAPAAGDIQGNHAVGMLCGIVLP
jgi:hypothetical protein